jgi:Concanavalin A-like lectin/glucanases superfamily
LGLTSNFSQKTCSCLTGFGWCIPFLGFHANGSLIAHIVVTSTTLRAVFGPAIPLAPQWTHIVQTWSQTNGLRLYIDGVLVAVRSINVGSYAASSTPMYVTRGNSLGGATELTADNVCVLYNS